MNKYINTFASSGDYETYKASSALSTPNVAYIEDSKEVKYLNSMADLYDIYGSTSANSMTVRINGSYKSATVTDGNFMYNWTGNTITKLEECFNNNNSITTLDKFDINTSAVTNMRKMFNNCRNITSVNLSNITTSAVTNMALMFSQCSNLTSIDLGNFDTSSVNNMADLFYGCSKIKSLDLSNFNTSTVSGMSEMFTQCMVLRTIDISNWDTSSVTDSTKMFYLCQALTTVTMNNTNTTTFDMIKAQLVSDNVASHVTIIRDGVNWKYQNGAWVEA